MNWLFWERLRRGAKGWLFTIVVSAAVGGAMVWGVATLLEWSYGVGL